MASTLPSGDSRFFADDGVGVPCLEEQDFVRAGMPVDLDWVSGQKILGSEHEMLRAAVL